MTHRNDLNLKDFEAILKEERAKTEKNIGVIESEVNTMTDKDEVGDDADITALRVDYVTDKEIIHHLTDKISEIDAALARVQDGTYGICKKTSQAIPVERLVANPLAQTVVSG